VKLIDQRTKAVYFSEWCDREGLVVRLVSVASIHGDRVRAVLEPKNPEHRLEPAEFLACVAWSAKDPDAAVKGLMAAVRLRSFRRETKARRGGRWFGWLLDLPAASETIQAPEFFESPWKPGLTDDED
jgi:hypothetical protein